MFMNFLEGNVFSLILKYTPNGYLTSHVEDSDSSILHAVAREILEETGLIVHEIIGEFPPMEYSVEKILPAESEVVGPTAVIKTTLQLNFVVKVAPVSSSTGLLEVTLNPQEHQNYAWITKSDLANYVMTEEMKVVVRDALDWGEENIDRFRA
jgi:8-oxo-dGTP pyrophosphatase MutT (NUDIX family)